MFGKFLSVITYDSIGAWKNPELNRLLTKLKTREITEEDLDKLYSLGVLSIETTMSSNLGTRFVRQIANHEGSDDENSILFNDQNYRESSSYYS